MPVESATYISDLNASNPTGADSKAEGDDHLRLLKSTIKATFPNVSGAVTPTHTELNYVDGVTSAIQTQLDSKAGLASPTFTGTPTAPTATAGTNTTQLATTAHVAASIAAVNAASGELTFSTSSSTSISLTAGQRVACTAASTVTYTLPASPTAGQRVGVVINNARTDTVIARNGNSIMGVAEDMTVDFSGVGLTLIYTDASNGWRLI